MNNKALSHAEAIGARLESPSKVHQGVIAMIQEVRSHISVAMNWSQEMLILLKGAWESADPGSREYVLKQQEVIQEMSKAKILSENLSAAHMEYIDHGDALIFSECVRVKKRIRDSAGFLK